MTRSAPPNPHAEQGRREMMAHNRAVDAAKAPPVKRPLYPLDVRLPVCFWQCNDCGCTLWWDDPAALYSGINQ